MMLKNWRENRILHEENQGETKSVKADNRANVVPVSKLLHQQ